MPKGWKPSSGDPGSSRSNISTSSHSEGTMPKGWKAPARDDTVYFSSESLSAGSVEPSDQTPSNPSPSKKERKRKGSKSTVSQSYSPQSKTTTNSKGIAIAITIIIVLLIWTIIGVSSGLIGQFWYWGIIILSIILGIIKQASQSGTGTPSRRRRRY